MLYSETLKNVNNHSITSFIYKVIKILYPSKVNYKRHSLCAEKQYFYTCCVTTSKGALSTCNANNMLGT